jgi:hypothetical protein
LIHANFVFARRLAAHEPLLVARLLDAPVARRARQLPALDAVAPDLLQHLAPAPAAVDDDDRLGHLLGGRHLCILAGHGLGFLVNLQLRRRRGHGGLSGLRGLRGLGKRVAREAGRATQHDRQRE